ncbi:MAG: glycoside hydrolase [Anaerophaga sp.]|uniref:NlpC/P60 family protein n=1 Tax=Anaerophaga thermohalophila TaxID=177400 RepID=UPI000237C20A|nr:C40 family peptidase [Anaerophaga thermohalophila]MBZ4677349.1 glycoside hydrolase [Anaerophaga sp.]MDK2842497.1 gamma-D-glutamyl-L-lysine dipeptidyl-peptidase [Anaerophaga sp.]MDN5291898.1 gamma-D-glutamyl-L-lysine dipeptidyl-peptidase [Anaerophaga sp.]
MPRSICTYGFIPVRSEPSESSRLETQILFGESFDILERRNKWAYVRLRYDGYEGWIDDKLIEKLDDRDVELWEKSEGFIVKRPFVKVVKESDSTVQYLTAGSRVVFNGEDRNVIRIGYREFYWQGTMPESKVELEEVARGLLNAPYLWGGKTFYGIDCSGLVQVVYKTAGIFMPRNASQQIETGQVVSFVEEAKSGDLAFFDNEEGEIVHVGVCLGQGRILHASGSVRIDALDHQGIYNAETRKYSHHLRVIKRVI